MKKSLIVISTILILSVSVTALAAYAAFTDQATFASWFSASANKMKLAGVINGYSDGSFGPDRNVNRAELAVMFDKFAVAMGKPLAAEPTFCTEQFVSGLNLILQDQNGTPITGAQIGVQHYPGLPSDTSFDEDAANPGTYHGIGEGEGYYTVTIAKNGYATHIETVKLEKDECHVIPQTQTITLAKKLPQ